MNPLLVKAQSKSLLESSDRVAGLASATNRKLSLGPVNYLVNVVSEVLCLQIVVPHILVSENHQCHSDFEILFLGLDFINHLF